MENKYEHVEICVGHVGLFDRRISQEELIKIISCYPGISWLDLCSKIEGLLLVSRKNFNPQLFLAENLLCPSALERTKRRANNNARFFTLGQLNLLRKLAIVYGSDDNQDKIIEKIDISKALLGAQDIHNEYDEIVCQTDKFDEFCKIVIHNGYLNNNIDFATLFFRAKKIYIDQSDRFPIYPNKEFREFFYERVGLSPEEAISLNFALTIQFFQSIDKFFIQTSILPTNFFEQTTINPDIINSIIDSMTICFDDAKEILKKELDGKALSTLSAGYDLTIFRKNPLIKFPDGRLVCGNLNCLFEKSTQNIIWMPIKYAADSERDKLVIHLTHYRGLLFEEYLKELCSVMAGRNRNLSFTYIPSEQTVDHEEVGDAILIQGNKLVIFEAKSRQFPEDLKTTGDWENNSSFVTEFIKAAQQIEKAANKIKSGLNSSLGINKDQVEIIYPVIVTYEHIPTHGKMQRFIREKIKKAGYLNAEYMAPIEIMSIGDIENSIDAIDTVSLIDLLERKNLLKDIHASESNFNNFFANYSLHNTVISNGWQEEQIKKTWTEVFNPFFKDKFKQKNIEKI